MRIAGTGALDGRLRGRRVAGFGSTLDLLGTLAEDEVVLDGKIRIRIDAREEIAVTPEQTGGENAGPQILAEAVRNGGVAQIGFLHDLAASSRVLRQQLLEFHHQAGVFVQDFQNLLRRGGHAIKVVLDDVCCRTGRGTRALLRARRASEKSGKAAADKTAEEFSGVHGRRRSTSVAEKGSGAGDMQVTKNIRI